VKADRDMADGYRHGRSYLCRHCEERITVRNHEWVHVGSGWNEPDFLGPSCVKPGGECAGKHAQPVPLGTVQVFEEQAVPPNRHPEVVRDVHDLSGPYEWRYGNGSVWRCMVCGRPVSPHLSAADALEKGMCVCLPILPEMTTECPAGCAHPGSEECST